jgi:hypothetical protein
MSPDPKRPPLESLDGWLRSNPTEAVEFEAMTEDRMAELTDRAIAEGHRRSIAARQRRRRVIAGIGVGIVAVSGTAVAALVQRDAEPRPEVGVVCRAEADRDASGIIVQFGEDPVADCRAAWTDGRFAEMGVEDVPRDLTACVNPQGSIEVVPGDAEVCASLGLRPLDPTTTKTPAVEARAELQDRIVEEINMIDCLTAEQAAETARKILADLDLSDWPVRVNPDAVGASCAKAGIGPDGQHVFIFAN